MPAHSEDPRRLKPWMFIAAVVLIGIVAAVIVGLSGPDIPDDLLPPPAPAPAAPAMPAAPPAAAPAAK
jgi:hypothetical protein